MYKDKHEDHLKFKPNEGINWDILAPGPGDVLIPTYGEFGGLGYTGGELFLPPGSPSPAEAYKVKPADPLDALFRFHDMAYDPGITPGVDDRVAGDLALIQGIA